MRTLTEKFDDFVKVVFNGPLEPDVRHQMQEVFNAGAAAACNLLFEQGITKEELATEVMQFCTKRH